MEARTTHQGSSEICRNPGNVVSICTFYFHKECVYCMGVLGGYIHLELEWTLESGAWCVPPLYNLSNHCGFCFYKVINKYIHFKYF